MQNWARLALVFASGPCHWALTYGILLVTVTTGRKKRRIIIIIAERDYFNNIIIILHDFCLSFRPYIHYVLKSSIDINN